MKIKSSILGIGLLFFVVLSLNAQKNTYYIAADAGVSTFYRTSDNLTFDSRTVATRFNLTTNIGAHAERRLSNKLFVDVGFKYLNMGTKEEEVIQEFLSPEGIRLEYIADNIRINSHYLGLPVALKFKHKRFHFMAGYQLLYFLGAKYKYETGVPTPGVQPAALGDSRKYSESATFNSWDSGLVFGINFEITPKIAVRFHTYEGLHKILSDKDPEASLRKNKQLTLGVQYYLGQGKE